MREQIPTLRVDGTHVEKIESRLVLRHTSGWGSISYGEGVYLRCRMQETEEGRSRKSGSMASSNFLNESR
jgi:hypothetical protein